MRSSLLILLSVPCAAVAQLAEPPPVPSLLDENPLFDVGRSGGDLLLPPLPAPALDSTVPDPAQPKAKGGKSSGEEEKLMALAMHVAPSVVTLRVWDEFGRVISSGVGCFVSKDGLLLTDAGLIHPEIASRVDYITTTAADGRNYSITGWHVVDLRSGVALLQSEEKDVAPLPVRAEADFRKPRACRFLAVDEKRGLIFTDAVVEKDESLAGGGWLNVSGQDSAGAPGSPLLDENGYIIGIVSLRLPGRKWFNYALPASSAAYEVGKKWGQPRSLKQLPKSPVAQEIVKTPAFLNVWEDLQAKKITRSTRALLRLTGLYPRSAECWALLGLCCTQLGAHAEATHCQRKAAALDPQTGLYWQQLALAQMKRDVGKPDLEAEREALEESVRLRPADQLAWYTLATRLVAEQRHQQADEALRQVIKLENDYAPAYYLLAYVRGKLGDLPGANVAIERCLELSSSSAAAWFYRGLLLDKQKRYAQAAESYAQAARLDAQLPHVWRNLALAYERAGDSTAARRTERDAAAALKRKP
jgi:tetratricopeptide (TPR) repeat protein